ncbi:MAG: hypothetical protein V7641_3921 [Blastocatellia bacterium]
MNLPVRSSRVLLSLMLAVTVTSLFTLRVYAASEPKAPANESMAVQDCTGTLTIKSGKVMLNGNEAQTGATVMNGAVISTSDNGSVIIDLGAVGKIELGHHTTVTLDCAPGTIHGRTTCNGKVRIENRVGQVNVTVPKVETILPGKHETYDDPAEFTAPAGSSILIECRSRKVGGLLVGPGLLGLLALLGVGAAVAAGIAVGNGDSSSVGRPPVSGA